MSSAFGNDLEHGGYLQGKQVAHIPQRLPQAKRGTWRRVTVRGEQVLARECKEVTEFGTPELKALINDMFATMEVASGVGLAANQIGVDLKVFVFDCPDALDVRHVGHICNPVIDEEVAAAAELDYGTEGCLSAPGPIAEVPRPWTARVTGFDWKGNPVSFSGEGLFARCLHHETDHLNGVMYVDHLDDVERERVLTEMSAMQTNVWSAWEENAVRLGKGSATPF